MNLPSACIYTNYDHPMLKSYLRGMSTFVLQFNIQFTYDGFKQFELYAGVKNLLNWTPDRGNPFIISRTDDPFNKNVSFDANGQVIATPDNPYALIFDPSYVYAPIQGVRTFLGIRFKLN